VLLCVPAPVALRLYRNPPEHERPYLAASGYTPMLKVACLTDRPLAPRCARPLYALLTPDGGPLAGLIIDHAKHPARVPAGRGLVTLIAAPAAMADLFDAPDAEVVAQLLAPAQRYVPELGAATTETLVHRFRHGLPEVTPAALALRADFMARPAAPVDYASDWVMARPNSEGALRAADLAVARVLARQDSAVAKELT
jgi:oxygen-dependent protoporphyrinogen oxidase